MTMTISVDHAVDMPFVGKIYVLARRGYQDILKKNQFCKIKEKLEISSKSEEPDKMNSQANETFMKKMIISL